MKTIHLLTISAAIAFSTVAFSVGCSAPTVQSFEPEEEESDGKSAKKKSKKGDDEDEEESSSKKTKSSQSTSKRPGNSSGGAAPGDEIPGGEIPGGEIPGGEIPGGDEEACFMQCISGNPAAVQIDQQWMACADQCGNNDACLDQCDLQADRACQQNPAACNLLGQCADQCFGPPPGR